MRAVLCAALALVVCIGDAKADHSGMTPAEFFASEYNAKNSTPLNGAKTYFVVVSIYENEDDKGKCPLTEDDVKKTILFPVSFTKLRDAISQDTLSDLALVVTIHILPRDGLCSSFVKFKVSAYEENGVGHLRHNRYPIYNGVYEVFSRSGMFSIGSNGFNKAARDMLDGFSKEFVTQYNEQNK